MDSLDGTMERKDGGEWYSAEEVDAFFARAAQPPGLWHSVAIDPPPPTMDRVVLVFTGNAYSAEYADDVNSADHVMWMDFPLVRTSETK
jgi:hypothetical protein